MDRLKAEPGPEVEDEEVVVSSSSSGTETT